MAQRYKSMLNIFITNLGKYNEGQLIGEWVSLPVAKEELEKVYTRIGINAEYEEMFISDYETDMNYEVNEYDNIDELNEMMETIADLDESDIEALDAMMEEGYSFNEALDKVQNGDYSIYYDCHDMEDVAMEIIESCGMLDGVPENIARYFDYKAYGRDLSFEGHFVFNRNDNCIQIY